MPDTLHPVESIAATLDAIRYALDRQNDLLESINYTLQNRAPQPIVVEQRGVLSPTPPTYIS